MECQIVGCTNEQKRPKGMCHAHYERHLKAKRAGHEEDSAQYNFDVKQKPLRTNGYRKYNGKSCMNYGCERPASVKHLCKTCYMTEYMRKRRKTIEEKARKYDELMAKAAAVDAQVVPTEEREAAPAPRLERIAHETGLPLDQIVDMDEQGEFEGLDEGEMIEYAKEWTGA